MGDRQQSLRPRAERWWEDDGRSPIARSLTDMCFQSTGQDKGKSKGQNKGQDKGKSKGQNKGENKGKSKGQSNSCVQQLLQEQERRLQGIEQFIRRDGSSRPQSRQERQLPLQSMNGKFIALPGNAWKDLVASYEWETKANAVGQGQEKRAKRFDSQVQDLFKGKASSMNDPD